MSYIPIEELKERGGLTMAPMIDFLFLMLALFASFAFSRVVLRDTEIDLVQSKVEIATPVDNEYRLINITISSTGNYTWVTEMRDHPMETPEHITEELLRQYQKGLLPNDKLKTQVLLKIDREARWEPILHLVLALREAGFEVRPVYEPAL